MTAVTYRKYGGSEELSPEEVETPRPARGEVLVGIRATSLNAADKLMLLGKPAVVRLSAGLRAPKNPILGADFAGVVEECGPGVTRWAVGDEVFGDLSDHGFGGLAQFVCVREELLAGKPAGVSFAAAAATPLAGTTALQALRDVAAVQPGERVAVSGASGGVGSMAVQIARALGAEVTAVCSSGKLEQARELGASEVIDYTQEDFTERLGAFDVIAGVNGFHPIGHYKRALADGGRYVMIGGEGKQIAQAMLLGPLSSFGSSKQLKGVVARSNAADLAILAGWLEAGTVVAPVEKTYPLNETAAAMRHLMDGHSAGKIVVVQNDA